MYQNLTYYVRFCVENTKNLESIWKKTFFSEFYGEDFLWIKSSKVQKIR